MSRVVTMRRTTMKDIAQSLGVSTSTVSRVLNQNAAISEATREKIWKAVEEARYIRNAVARGLALKSSHLIGLIVPSISNPFFSEIARGAHDRAQEKSYLIALCHTDRKVETEELFSQTLLEAQVAGMIFAGGSMSEKHLRRLRELHVPFVVGGRHPTGLKVPSVGVDNVAVGYQATQHLIGLGHKKIMFVSGPSDSATSRDRQRGYLDALQAHGFSPQVAEGDFRMESGLAVASRLKEEKRRPTAIFAANDMMAIGIVLGLTNLGLSVPGDAAVVGCDDIPMASLIKPALTTIRVPMYEIGARAMELLLALLKGEQRTAAQSVVLGCELAVRESAA